MSRTEIDLNRDESLLFSYGQQILTIGSCFSNCTGSKLQQAKFNTLTNPFGVIFNPLSIFKLLSMSLGNIPLNKNLFIERDERWLHHDFHSDLNATSQNELIKLLKTKLETTGKWIRKSETLIITFGTSFVHRHLDENTIIANCHKVNQKAFSKELLTQRHIIEAFDQLHKLLPSNTQIILSVSPVRHTREGLAENMESKSILRSACGSLTRTYSNVNYFPSFEIMMDDLRDYRYYKQDLIHPSDEAEDYIFNKFTESNLKASDKVTFQKVIEINRALNHKAFNPQSTSHKEFLTETIQKMKELNNRIDFNVEISRLEQQLNS